MSNIEAEALLRNTLRLTDDVWATHFAHAGPEGKVEISIRGGPDKPDAAHLAEAAACIASLPDIRHRMEHTLNSVPADNPLFPAIGARSWWLEALSFVSDEPERGVAIFSLNEDGYDFIYVEYVVELERGQVVSASARTR